MISITDKKSVKAFYKDHQITFNNNNFIYKHIFYRHKSN